MLSITCLSVGGWYENISVNIDLHVGLNPLLLGGIWRCHYQFSYLEVVFLGQARVQSPLPFVPNTNDVVLVRFIVDHQIPIEINEKIICCFYFFHEALVVEMHTLDRTLQLLSHG